MFLWLPWHKTDVLICITVDDANFEDTDDLEHVWNIIESEFREIKVWNKIKCNMKKNSSCNSGIPPDTSGEVKAPFNQSACSSSSHQCNRCIEAVDVQGSLYVSACCCISEYGCAPSIQALSRLLIIKLRRIYNSSFTYSKENKNREKQDSIKNLCQIEKD